MLEFQHTRTLLIRYLAWTALGHCSTISQNRKSYSPKAFSQTYGTHLRLLRKGDIKVPNTLTNKLWGFFVSVFTDSCFLVLPQYSPHRRQKQLSLILIVFLCFGQVTDCHSTCLLAIYLLQFRLVCLDQLTVSHTSVNFRLVFDDVSLRSRLILIIKPQCVNMSC